ncbi:MAG: ATP-binding protein [Aquirufa antheringensis]|nr:ATP-binding protein [Aquirufa antheringensis]
MAPIETVSIKIKTGVYGQFRNLNNKVWYALGEFVDNSFSSYEQNKVSLKSINRDDYRCIVEIDINWELDYISIKDNAAGISDKYYSNAFEPANIPIDNTGLNEFGMGMKTASIWLADRWKVTTSSYDEDFCKEIEFDLKKVIENDVEQLIVKKTPKKEKRHFTEIFLSGLSKNAPKSNQLNKIKSHLSSIYRKFIQTNDLILIVNGEKLEYEELAILNAPLYSNPDGESIYWKKEIDFQTGNYTVKGFIGLLETMSTSVHNGLSLFRRGRVIEGSFDEKYRPKILCGQPGSPRDKRIFGELELEGFDVSFNKGSFTQTDDLDFILELIKEEISRKDFDLYNQAEKYKKHVNQETEKKIADDIIKVMKRNSDEFKSNLSETLQKLNSNVNKSTTEIIQKPIQVFEEEIDYLGENYIMILSLISDTDNPDDLYGITSLDGDQEKNIIRYHVNLKHPFFFKFHGIKTDFDRQKPIMAIIKSLVLSEIVAKAQGTKHGGYIRKNFNEFLKILN